MLKSLLPLAVLMLVVSMCGGCAWGKKNKKPASSSRLYEGDSPSIRYNDERETAGGAFNPS